MKFPRYRSLEYPTPEITPIDAYVSFVGQHEADNQAELESLKEGDLRRISMLIGQGCALATIDDKSNLADFRFQLAADEAEKRPGVDHEHLVFHNLANALITRDDFHASERARKKLHEGVVGSLWESKTQAVHAGKNGNWGTIETRRLVGKSGEYRVLCAITRYAHPWLLAAPALTHHDIKHRDTSTHGPSFDSLIVESIPGREPSVTKTQVKTSCFGECDRDRTLEKIDSFQEMRSAYDQNTALISACCDLHSGTKENGNQWGHVDKLLLKEMRRTATPDEVLALDTVTNNLLLQITGNLDRRGLQKVQAARHDVSKAA